jgi:streptogramin lyase
VGGLAQYKQGQIHVYTEKDGISQSYIRAIGEDQQKQIWVGSTSSGLFRLVAGRFVSYKEKGIPAASIRSLLVDHEGAVWIGSNEAVYRWKDNKVTTYTQNDGLPADPIYVIMEDSTHTLWMGSYGGVLVRWKQGKITRITQAQGLYNDVVFHLLEDNNGLIWMSSLRGISSVSRQMLNDFADGKIDRIQCNSYTSSDGMVNSECTGNAQSGGCKTSDGRLWFGTTGGIVVVDPKHLQKNSLPPPVVIERVVVDQEDYSPYDYGCFAPGKGQVEFHYGGLSYITPQKVNFRYKLEGFEKDWRLAGTRHGAFYTNLSPGKYVFHVTACNSDGVWNETGTSFAFELEPYFYQTWWFYGLAILMVVGTGFSMYRLRVWQLLAREKELTIRVNEATARIKTLNGLIPICANCKKIRDYKGYWNQLEQYIHDHSEATFSHGVCPECAEKLYGNLYKKMKNQQGATSAISPPSDSPKE